MADAPVSRSDGKDNADNRSILVTSDHIPSKYLEPINDKLSIKFQMRSSGGGDVENVQILSLHKDGFKAKITFFEQNVVESVQRTDHLIFNKPVSVQSFLEAESANEKLEKSASMETSSLRKRVMELGRDNERLVAKVCSMEGDLRSKTTAQDDSNKKLEKSASIETSSLRKRVMELERDNERLVAKVSGMEGDLRSKATAQDDSNKKLEKSASIESLNLRKIVMELERDNERLVAKVCSMEGDLRSKTTAQDDSNKIPIFVEVVAHAYLSDLPTQEHVLEFVCNETGIFAKCTGDTGTALFKGSLSQVSKAHDLLLRFKEKGKSTSTALDEKPSARRIENTKGPLGSRSVSICAANFAEHSENTCMPVSDNGASDDSFEIINTNGETEEENPREASRDSGIIQSMQVIPQLMNQSMPAAKLVDDGVDIGPSKNERDSHIITISQKVDDRNDGNKAMDKPSGRSTMTDLKHTETSVQDRESGTSDVNPSHGDDDNTGDKDKSLGMDTNVFKVNDAAGQSSSQYRQKSVTAENPSNDNNDQTKKDSLGNEAMKPSASKDDDLDEEFIVVDNHILVYLRAVYFDKINDIAVRNKVHINWQSGERHGKVSFNTLLGLDDIRKAKHEVEQLIKRVKLYLQPRYVSHITDECFDDRVKKAKALIKKFTAVVHIEEGAGKHVFWSEDITMLDDVAKKFHQAVIGIDEHTPDDMNSMVKGTERGECTPSLDSVVTKDVDETTHQHVADNNEEGNKKHPDAEQGATMSSVLAKNASHHTAIKEKDELTNQNVKNKFDDEKNHGKGSKPKKKKVPTATLR